MKCKSERQKKSIHEHVTYVSIVKSKQKADERKLEKEELKIKEIF
jgi:hypothetical protein